MISCLQTVCHVPPKLPNFNFVRVFSIEKHWLQLFLQLEN
jgi:hypothetical protein